MTFGTAEHATRSFRGNGSRVLDGKTNDELYDIALAASDVVAGGRVSSV